MDYNYIQHHGVKGQRWGVRRYQNKDGSLTAAGKKKRSTSEIVKDARKYVKDKRAKIKEENERRAAEQRRQDILDGKIKSKDMTDAELKERIERLRLEESYNRVVNSNKTEIAKGQNVVSEYVGPAAKKILWDTSVDVAAQGVKYAFTKAMNESIGEDVIFTNNKKKS